MISAGLYVHVPFCLTRCGYCDFNAHAGLDRLKRPYVEALRREADQTAPVWDGVRFVSVFLGGGTPTTLSSGAIGSLLDHFRSRFDLEAGAEVTCEANPDTVDRRSLEELRSAGITRLSLGVQSFDPAVLAALERVHPPSSARRSYAEARRAGFDDINVDLIFGAQGETVASWLHTLKEALALGPEHLSCYALTVEPGTPLGAAVAAGTNPAPDPDLQAQMYETACRLLASAGYRHYEVSNWARPGHECLHNLGYWEGRAYLGLGAGAHSYRDGRRWWNVRPPGRYIELTTGGHTPGGGGETLDPEARRLERLLLGVRRAEGVPAGWVPAEAAAELAARGLARLEGGRFALNDRGLFLASEVVLALSP
jgi:putative oxygen-independent coproporphyrinogen III oxidase